MPGKPGNRSECRPLEKTGRRSNQSDLWRSARLFLGLVLSMVLLSPAWAAPRPGSWLPGQVLIKLKNPAGGGARKKPRHFAGASTRTTLPLLGWEVVRLPSEVGVAAALDYYRSQPEVEYAEPNYAICLFAVPNDPMESALWGFDLIRATQAWDVTTGSPEIVVAMVDTGLDFAHPDLALNVWTNPIEIAGNGIDDDHDGYVDDLHGINTLNGSGDVRDDDGHGTHVAGTIGAVGNNGLGVVGLNWRVKLVSIKIFSADDSSGTAGAVEGYEYLISLKNRGVNVRVINNSWGGPFPSRALYDAFRAAEAAGIVSVCAAGNSNHNTDDIPEYPAGLDCESLIAVAASTRYDGLAEFSNFGNLTVHLAAPGESILSTYRGGFYQRMSGTSMAAPHVSGAAALLLAQNNALTPAQVKALLMSTVDTAPQWLGRVASGGRLNLGRAMERLALGPLPGLPLASNSPTRPWPHLSGLSRTSQGRWSSGSCDYPVISSNGQFVAFLTDSTNLAPGVTNSRTVVQWLDRASGNFSLASRALDGGLPSADCADVRISGDGRFVVFSTTASNLVGGDVNKASDVFLYDSASGLIELISQAVSGTGPGNADSDRPAISADGRYVAFTSDATNLVSGDSNKYRDVFVRDRQTHATTRASVGAAGAQSDYISDLPSISGDGRYVTFLSGADNLVSDAYVPAFHLYLRDRAGGATTRISKNSSGTAGNTNSGASSLSYDGRYIAFESEASNLVSGDTNRAQDIFLYDRSLGSLKRISVGNNGAQASVDCWGPALSANGRHVCFFSEATEFFPQSDAMIYNLFDYDRQTAKLSALGYNEAGQVSSDSNYYPEQSADGRFVVFESWAWNLTPGVGNGNRNLFLLDRGGSIPDLMIAKAGETNWQGRGVHGSNLVQRRELPLTNTTASFSIRLENDGPTNETFTVCAKAAPPGWTSQFYRGTTNITAAIIGAGWAISLPAASNVVLTLEVASQSATVGEALAEWLISATGARSNSANDVVRAVVTRTPSPPSLLTLSRAADGRLGNDNSIGADLSADGQYVVFTSQACELTNRDYNLDSDVFLLDRSNRVLTCVSKLANGTNGNGRSYSARISRNARHVVYQSQATNLVEGDTNDREDVFLYDRQTRLTSRVSVGPGGVQSSRDSGWARISADGRYVAFESLATNFVAGDTNGTWDVFVRDTLSNTVECVSMAGSHTANEESHLSALSADGSVVVFVSLAGNLATGDTNAVEDLFLWERGTTGVQLLSRTADGSPASDMSSGASISDDNRYVLFSSLATNLAVADQDTNSVTFLFDRQTSQLSQINPQRISGRQRGGFYGARLAPNGRLITLLADVADASGGSNHTTGLFSFDRLTGELTEISRRRDGQPGSGPSDGAVVSADGRYIAFCSRAPNLVGETMPALDQIVLHDRANFQPDEWICRATNAPYRGQSQFAESPQRVEQTLKFNYTNVFYVTLRNTCLAFDRFLFLGPTNIAGGIKARYFVRPAGTEITSSVTNKGWTSDWIASGASQEIRIEIVASNTNLFDKDLAFTCSSLTDPTKTDMVRLRLLRDDDNDGLPNSWEQRYFASLTNAVPGADADHDGFTNLAEYTAGTDPTNAASKLIVTSIQAGPGPIVTLTWPSVTNRFYTVQRALDQPTNLSRIADMYGSDKQTTYRDALPTNAPPSFYRIKVELP